MLENKITKESIVRIKVSLAGFVEGISKAAEAIRKLLQRIEEDKELREQLKAITKPPDTTELLEFIDKLSKEFKEIQENIDDKNKVRQSWKYNIYKSKFSSRIPDKRTIYHNCRNNC